MTNRDVMIDIPERRAVPIAEFEVRETNGTAHVEGYASIFDRGYDILGGPAVGGFTEHVSRSAFKTTLSANPDVVLLENHAGGPLARTKSGTLALATDTTGLISRFDLDLRDPQAKSVFVKLDRGDYDEMSFAFRVKAQTWSDDETTRSLDEVSLHKGDVSIVNFGANPHTSVGVRSAVKMLAREEFSDEELAELRAMSDEAVDLALARLKDVRADEKPEEREVIVINASQVENTPIDLTVDIVGMLHRALGFEDDHNGEGGAADALAQAIHDLVADAAGCTPPGDAERNLTVVDAQHASASAGNLTADAVARMCRPEDSPEPLTLAEAEQLAS